MIRSVAPRCSRQHQPPSLHMLPGEGGTMHGKLRALRDRHDGEGDTHSVLARSGAGYVEARAFAPDFLAWTVNGYMPGPEIEKLRGEDWIKFHLRGVGNGAFLFGEDRRVDLTAPLGTLRFQPAGMDESHWYGDAAAPLWFTVYCKRRSLMEELEIPEESLPSGLARHVAGHSDAPFLTALPVFPALQRLLRDVAELPVDGPLRPVYLEAKATELVCLMLQAGLPGAQGQALSRRDRDKAREAAAILANSLSAPPSVPQLASILGLNRTRLRLIFKAEHGRTITDFLTALRLERAWQLLEAGDLPVSQVGEAVGYGYGANFATAFKRHFGISPRAVQGRRRPLSG